MVERIVALGDATETSLAQMPHDITIDRCYIHGDPVAGSKRGVQMAGINLTLINSYVSEIHVIAQDSQAVGGWTAPGPFHILNNYLEAAGENLLLVRRRSSRCKCGPIGYRDSK